MKLFHCNQFQPKQSHPDKRQLFSPTLAQSNLDTKNHFLSTNVIVNQYLLINQIIFYDWSQAFFFVELSCFYFIVFLEYRARFVSFWLQNLCEIFLQQLIDRTKTSCGFVFLTLWIIYLSTHSLSSKRKIKHINKLVSSPSRQKQGWCCFSSWRFSAVFGKEGL